MIPRITRGSSARAALAYDFGPGRREEHVNARTVAGNVPGTWRDQAQMIDETVAARPRVVKGIWRTSLRAAPEDRVLSDEEWGRIATGYIGAMGLSEHPWTATRHGDDHIHLTVSRVSWEGKVASLSHDFAKAQSACRAIEVEHQLVDASTRFDRDWPQISHGERERSARLAAARAAGGPGSKAVEAHQAARPGVPGQLVAGSEKEQLRELVANATMLAAASKGGRDGFEGWLTKSGVAFRCNVASTGRVSGYSYGLPGHLDARGEQVFFKGSQLGKAHAWAATSAVLTATADHRVDRHVDRHVDHHVDHQQHHGAALRVGPRTHKRVDDRATAVPGAVEKLAEELVEKPVAQPARRAVEQPGNPAGEQPVQKPAAQVHREQLLAEHHAVLAQRQQLTRQRLEATASHQSSLAALQAARRVLEVASRSHRDASSDWQELARQVQRTTAAITELIAAGQELSAARRAREQLAAPWAALGGRPTAAAQRAAALETAQRAGEVAQAREVTGRARVVKAEGAVQVAHRQLSAAQVEADRTGKVAAAATVREQRALTQVTAWEVEQAHRAAPSPLVQQALDRARGRGPGLGHLDPGYQSPGRDRGLGPSR